MKRIVGYISLLSLVLVSVVSCSGSAGKRGTKAVEDAAVATESDPRPAKRLIEVLSPADNASYVCTDRIVFSVGPAAGQTEVDSVQVWVGSRLARTLTTIP
nr:hypothetical protein [Bacteroidales bacterium]